jgi:hypothetical protein
LRIGRALRAAANRGADLVYHRSMTYKNLDSSMLRVSSLRELLGHEEEIVRRISAAPNGGQLLLLDPQRLLRDLGIEMTAEAVEECRVAHPELFARTGREHAYDAVARSRPGDEVRVTVNGLFRKGRA